MPVVLVLFVEAMMAVERCIGGICDSLWCHSGSISLQWLKYNHHLRTNCHNCHHCTTLLPSLPHLISQHCYSCHHCLNHHETLPSLPTQLLRPPLPTLKQLPPVSPLQPQPPQELLPPPPLSSDIGATVELPTFTELLTLNHFVTCTSVVLQPFSTNHANFAISATTYFPATYISIIASAGITTTTYTTAISAYSSLNGLTPLPQLPLLPPPHAITVTPATWLKTQ